MGGPAAVITARAAQAPSQPAGPARGERPRRGTMRARPEAQPGRRQAGPADGERGPTSRLGATAVDRPSAACPTDLANMEKGPYAFLYSSQDPEHY